MRLRLSDVLVRAAQRGYTPEEIKPCLSADLGDGWFDVDTASSFYPAKHRDGYIPSMPIHQQVNAWLADMGQPAVSFHWPSAPQVTHGPGTELKKVLAKIGITSTPTCSCNARARRMDEEEAREPGWCEAHIDEIVGWLREEAEKRGLPFVDVAGRMLVRHAVRNARKAAAS